MVIHINDNKTVGEIQESFNEKFPFLKIEVYNFPHHWYKSAQDKNAFPPGMRIGDIRKNHQHGFLSLFSWMRTADVEHLFRKQFDLNIQICCQHNKECVEIIGTDKMTLQEQNELGREELSNTG